MEHLPALLTRDQPDQLMNRLIERIKRDRYGLWAVELRASGELIGFVGLAVPIWESGVYSLHRDRLASGKVGLGARVRQ
jgi:RimJ/RimL family protein N-acetyltransferase